MTPSLSSPPNQSAKIILIAGLNNNDLAMEDLKNELTLRGYTCSLLNLPGQGSDRSETQSIEKAQQVFDKNLSALLSEDYGVVAFSTGALYFNLWLNSHLDKKPTFQILLAPAFKIRNQKVLESFFQYLPNGFKIKSFAPKLYRRYSFMLCSEYRLLFELVGRFKEINYSIPAPYKIYVDPRDELVDAKTLAKIFKGSTQLKRRKTRNYKAGMYHAIFSTHFWAKDEWDEFIQNIDKFIKESES